jgi:Zn-dependent protease with chaperone function
MTAPVAIGRRHTTKPRKKVMRHPLIWFAPILLGCLFFPSFLSAQASPQVIQRDQAKEETLYQELRKTSPKSIPAFKSGTEAMDTGNYEDAVRSFNDVLKQSPDFAPALRRLGHSLIGVGKRDDGLAMIQKAIDLDRSADNLLSMAMARVDPGDNNYKPANSEIQKALALADESVKLDNGTDPAGLTLVADLSLQLKNIDKFTSAVHQLRMRFPDLLQTHYFTGIELANDGNFDKAVAEIRTAESLGLGSDEANQLISQIEKAKDEESFGLAGYFKYFYIFAAIVVLWAIGLGFLFIAGKSLSAQTLRSIENSDPNDITGGGHTGIKNSYRKLITVAGVYYYISQPIVVLLVVIVTAGIILGFLWIGTIPIKLVLILAFVGFGSIFYMFKSLLIRPKVEDPGRVLTEDEAPRLWALVRSVATDINTRPADEIRLTPACELAVYERGGFRKKIQDKAQRVLIIGVGTLDGFDQNAFRAVLAHEYGHFSNRDTAGGDVAYRVNSDIIRLAEAMYRGGTATIYNLVFHFIRLYHYLFRRITHGASRLQEVLADRVAVHHYGTAAFRGGLEHVIRREIEFNRVADREINEALSANRAFSNLYDLRETSEEGLRDIDKQLDDHLNKPTTADDTHPSPADRFRLAERITTKEAADLSGQVWDLFDDRLAVTSGMNKWVEEKIRAKRYGSAHDMLV